MRLGERFRAGLPYLVVIMVGAFLYYRADHFEFEGVPGRIGPGAWPKIVLVLMLLAAFSGFLSSALGRGKGGAERGGGTEEIEALLRPPEIYPQLVWLAVGATFVYLLLLPIVGFFLGTIVYIAALLYLGHYRRIGRGLALSVALTVGFMLIFMRAVYVALPTGTPPFDHVSFTVMAMMGVR